MESKYYLALSLINGIGYKYSERILEQLKYPSKVFTAHHKEIKDLENLGDAVINNILASREKIDPDKIEKKLMDLGIGYVTNKDKDYPENLKYIYNPPMVLYFKGDYSLVHNTSIAIVGSRKCSQYGRIVAERFSFELSKNNITIVSGLAKGIDTSAHIGALKSMGKTIGVLGCGLNFVYPAENRFIYRRIVEEKGLLLSEYFPTQEPKPGFFPARNRIISGLSRGIMVVEAGEKSGALITVSIGLEQGKNIYVVPGQINSPYSKGTNSLLKLGAIPVTKSEDIIQEIREYDFVVEKHITEEERAVLMTLEPTGTYRDELILNAGSLDVDLILLQLEIKGLIKRLPGDKYIPLEI